MATPVTRDVLDSPAVAILCGLEADGFRVELTDDDALVIAPRSRLTPERMQAIAACKGALKELVRCCDVGVQARREAFAAQLVLTQAPGVPAFLFKAGLPYVKGTCFSCGDALPELRFSRCWRCSLAWRLVCTLPVPADLAAALDVARVA